MPIRLGDMTPVEILVLSEAVSIDRKPGHVAMVPDNWVAESARLVDLGLIEKPTPVVTLAGPVDGWSTVVPTRLGRGFMTSRKIGG